MSKWCIALLNGNFDIIRCTSWEVFGICDRVDIKDSRLSYFVLSEDIHENETIAEKMLLNNNIDELISVELRLEDNKKCFYYNTLGMKSVSDYIDKEMLDFTFLYRIYDGIMKSLIKGEAYFIREENYMVQPEYIYWIKKDERIKVCCIPWGQCDFQKDVLELTELFLKKTDHKDDKAVKFIYGMYDIIINDGFVYDSIKLYMDEFADDEEYIYEKEEHVIQKKSYNNKNSVSYNAYGLIACDENKLDRKLEIRTIPDEIWLDVNNEFDLEGCDSKEYTVGRSKKNDIVIPCIHVSRKHATIHADNGIMITDIGSSNGTYVNGKKISANITVKCRENDVVTFADIRYKVVKKKNCV